MVRAKAPWKSKTVSLSEDRRLNETKALLGIETKSMTDEELKALVASNAQAIESNAQTIENNAKAIENNAKAIENNARAMDRLERKTESLDGQLSLLTRQVQAMANTQAANSNLLNAADRNIQGIYDILQTYAKEQHARSQLIDQQIQSLIDERRRS